MTTAGLTNHLTLSKGRLNVIFEYNKKERLKTFKSLTFEQLQTEIQEYVGKKVDIFMAKEVRLYMINTDSDLKDALSSIEGTCKSSSIRFIFSEKTQERREIVFEGEKEERKVDLFPTTFSNLKRKMIELFQRDMTMYIKTNRKKYQKMTTQNDVDLDKGERRHEGETKTTKTCQKMTTQNDVDLDKGERRHEGEAKTTKTYKKMTTKNDVDLDKGERRHGEETKTTKTYQKMTTQNDVDLDKRERSHEEKTKTTKTCQKMTTQNDVDLDKGERSHEEKTKTTKTFQKMIIQNDVDLEKYLSSKEQQSDEDSIRIILEEIQTGDIRNDKDADSLGPTEVTLKGHREKEMRESLNPTTFDNLQSKTPKKGPANLIMNHERDKEEGKRKVIFEGPRTERLEVDMDTITFGNLAIKKEEEFGKGYAMSIKRDNGSCIPIRNDEDLKHALFKKVHERENNYSIQIILQEHVEYEKRCVVYFEFDYKRRKVSLPQLTLDEIRKAFKKIFGEETCHIMLSEDTQRIPVKDETSMNTAIYNTRSDDGFVRVILRDPLRTEIVVNEINKREIAKLRLEIAGNEGAKMTKSENEKRILFDACIDHISKEPAETWKNAEMITYDSDLHKLTISSGSKKHKFQFGVDEKGELRLFKL